MALFARRTPAPEPAPAAAADEPLPRRTVAEHARAVTDGVRPLDPVALPLADVAGLELCEEIVSDVDVPLVSTALVTGYGVRAANIVGAEPGHPIDLVCVAHLDRRDVATDQVLAPGACVLLEEGVPLPRAVDAVVPAGEVRRSDRTALFTAEARVGQHIAARGSQVPEGEVLLRPGGRLDPRQLAVLAAAGHDRVLVRPRPRVVVLPVGATLLPLGASVTAVDQDYPAAVPVLTALARADGADARPADPVPRAGDDLRAALVEAAAAADVVLVVGQHEADAHLAAQLLDADLAHADLGVGHAVAVGSLGAARVLVLPAEPLAAHVAYRGWVAPLLGLLAGRPRAPQSIEAALAHPIEPGRPRLVPVLLGDGRATPLTGLGLLDAARADGAVQAGAAGLPAGASVTVTLLGPARS